MSQIKKLQSGKTVPKPKYGKLTIDAREYEATPELLEALGSYIGGLDTKHQRFLGDIEDALRNGQNISLNTHTNRISGLNEFSALNERQNNRSRNGRTRLGKYLDAITDSDVNQSNEAIALLGRFYPSVGSTSTTSGLKTVSNNPVNFDYDIDSDGNQKLSSNPINAYIENRFNDYYDWLDNPDDWSAKNTWSNKIENEDILKSWYNSLDATDALSRRLAAKQAIANAIDEVKTSNGWENVSEKTKELLRYFNIGNGTSSSTNGSSISDSERNKRALLKKNGYNENLYDLLGDEFNIDKNGNIVSTSGAFNFGFGNAYFNDDFFNSQYGVDGKLNPLRGLTYYNGTLYKNTSPELSKILNVSGGYNDLVKSGNFIDADKIIRTRWTPEEMDNPVVLGADKYSSFIKPSMQFSNLTGLMSLKDGSMGDGDQLIQYLDLTSPTQNGPYTGFNYKFALLNNRGDLIRDVDRSELQKIIGGQSAGDLLTYNKISNRNAGSYYNKYYEDIVGKNKKPTGIRIYRDVNDPNANVILHIDGLKGSAEGKDIALPKEIAEILMEDQSWIDSVVGNSKTRSEFAEMLSNLTRRGAFNMWDPNSNFYTDLYAYAPYKRLGLSKELTKKLRSAFIKYSKGNRNDRINQYLLDAPEFKNGGKLQYISKLASGGFAGGSKTAQGVTERQVNKNVHDPRNASSLVEIGSDSWTDADTADLLALVGDVGSLGLAFVPGANIASAGVGAAGSLARYAADKERGTKGAGWQLALNLGMDAATLLPFLGGAAKTGKVAGALKTIASADLVKKAARIVITGASAWGLGSAVVNSATKIANGEKFTVRDVSNVVNGITAGVGIAKSGGFGKSTKKSTTTVFKEQNFKVGEADVKLTSDQLKDIAESADQAAALRSAISKQATSASKQDVASAAENLLKNKQNLFQRVLRKDGDLVLNVGKEKVSTETQAEATGNWLHDWWYRTGGYQQAYNKKLVNDGVDEVKVTRTSTRTPEMQYKSGIRIGGKQIKFTEAQINSIAKAPTMKQFDKFKSIVKKQNSSISDIDIENAFRRLLSSEQSGFRFRFPRQRVMTVESNTVGEIPTWYRGRTEGLSIGQPQPNGTKTITRTRTYDTRQGIARPNIILPLQLSGYEYDELPGTLYQPLYKKGGVLKAETGLSELGKKLFGTIDTSPEHIAEITRRYRDPMTIDIETALSNPTEQLPVRISTSSENPIKTEYLKSLQNRRSGLGEQNIPRPTISYGIIDRALGLRSSILAARGRRQYEKNKIAGLNASRVQDQAVRENQFTYNNPALDRAEANLRNEAVRGFKPMTSDVTQYNAQQQQAWGKLLDAQTQLTAQRSAADNQINLQNAEIARRNAMNEVATANQNRRTNAAIDAAIFDAKNERLIGDITSDQNRSLEIRNKLNQDRQLATQIALSDREKQYNSDLENYYKTNFGDLYTKYSNLPSDQVDYSSFQDYVYKTDPNLWNRKVNGIKALENAYNADVKRLSIRNRANFPNLVSLSKKGGYLRGSTRYTKEPDEQIWIDNNKAAHKAIAKLEDNMIKLLLRALK